MDAKRGDHRPRLDRVIRWGTFCNPVPRQVLSRAEWSMNRFRYTVTVLLCAGACSLPPFAFNEDDAGLSDGAVSSDGGNLDAGREDGGPAGCGEATCGVDEYCCEAKQV